jgi:chromosomal replication initiation ATPase DnaA
MTSLIREKRRRPRKIEVDINPTPMQLLRAICHILDLNVDEVRGARKFGMLVKGRAVFFHFGKKFGYAISDMGRLVGLSHATVLHHIKLYDEQLDKSKMYYTPELANELDIIRAKLKLRSITCV